MTFIGDEGKVNESDIVERADGTLDTGYRIILITDIISITEDNLLLENVGDVIKKSGGRPVIRPGNRKVIVFSNSEPAIECAINIIHNIQNLSAKANEVRIGISAGEPVTKQNEIFADAVQLASRLCDSAQNGQVLISSLAKELTHTPALQNYKQKKSVKFLDPEDEQFLTLLLETITSLLDGKNFTIDSLSKTLGMSKSRLYRKVTNLTGYSINSFIQELRLQKALKLIKNKYGNITQVAMEVGFSNPSYFAKNFQSRFGIAPLKALKKNS